MNSFLSLMESFPHPGFRPSTCDCIFCQRWISVVGVTQHTSGVHCQMWVYSHQRDVCYHITMDPASLSPPALHTYCACLLNLIFWISSTRHPTNPGYSSFASWCQKTAHFRRWSIGSQWCTSHKKVHKKHLRC